MKISTTIKTLLLVLLLATITSAQAQTVINNTLTEKHIRLKGTQISIVPPAGFGRLIEAPPGIEGDEKGASIMVYKADGYEPDSLYMEALFIALFDTAQTVDSFIINNIRARLTKGISEGGRGVYQLRFGTGWEAQIMWAEFPAADTALGFEIKQSLLSLVYEQPDTAIGDIFKDYSFTVNITGAGYQFVQNANSVMIFARGGHFNKTDPDNVMIVGEDALPRKTGKDWKSYVTKEVRLTKDRKIKGQTISRTNQYGVEAYIMQATEITVNGQQRQVYMVVLFGRRMYMMGAVYTLPEELAVIKKAFSTFKLKE